MRFPVGAEDKRTRIVGCALSIADGFGLVVDAILLHDDDDAARRIGRMLRDAKAVAQHADERAANWPKHTHVALVRLRALSADAVECIEDARTLLLLSDYEGVVHKLAAARSLGLEMQRTANGMKRGMVEGRRAKGAKRERMANVGGPVELIAA